MSQDQSALNTQPATPAVVLNPETVNALSYWLKRVKTQSHNLAEQFTNHESHLELVELTIGISLAFNLLENPLLDQEQTTKLDQGIVDQEQITTLDHEQITSLDQEQSALNTQPAKPAVVLNPETLAELVKLMELAKARAHDLASQPLYVQQQNAGLDFELAQVTFPIKQALALLDNATLQAKKPAKTITPPKRQTTGYRVSVDPLGYAIRILMDAAGCDVPVKPNKSPPANHRQVCLCCGNDAFAIGMTVCPQCDTKVIYRCRYVAIAGGV